MCANSAPRVADNSRDSRVLSKKRRATCAAGSPNYHDSHIAASRFRGLGSPDGGGGKRGACVSTPNVQKNPNGGRRAGSFAEALDGP